MSFSREPLARNASFAKEAFLARNADPILCVFFDRLLATIKLNPSSIRMDDLPHARIKRIMKQDACDPHPRMISAETVPLVAFAAQCFISSLTALAWKESTMKNKRNTLQVKDLKAAVHASSRFDFLIDVLDTFDAQLAAKDEAAIRACPERVVEAIPGDMAPIYDEQLLRLLPGPYAGEPYYYP